MTRKRLFTHPFNDAARAWGRTLATLAFAAVIYVAVMITAALITDDPILAVALSNPAALVGAITYRRLASPRDRRNPVELRSLHPAWWAALPLAVLICWVAGQTTAAWVYTLWGSPAFDEASDTIAGSSYWITLLTVVVLAPLGEEALMRGIAYPALRRHWPPILSALVTAVVFALLHGNAVQIVLTVPLGVLLAFVYETTRRLWIVIALHVLFNALSTFAPVELVSALAHPAVMPIYIPLALIALVALAPGGPLLRRRGAPHPVSEGIS